MCLYTHCTALLRSGLVGVLHGVLHVGDSLLCTGCACWAVPRFAVSWLALAVRVVCGSCSWPRTRSKPWLNLSTALYAHTQSVLACIALHLHSTGWRPRPVSASLWSTPLRQPEGCHAAVVKTGVQVLQQFCAWNASVHWTLLSYRGRCADVSPAVRQLSALQPLQGVLNNNCT